MTSDGSGDDLIAAALGELVAQLTYDLGRPPSAVDILGVIALSGPRCPGALVPSAYPLKFVVNRRRIEVGDHGADISGGAFANAADIVCLIAAKTSKSIGRVVTIMEICPDLASLLLSAPGLAAVDGEISGLSVVKSPPSKRLAIGDVVAVPALAGGIHLAVALARNRFGLALCCFVGMVEVYRSGMLRDATVVALPVYTDDRLLSSGTWLVVDHDESLLKRFPGDPEIFHRPHEMFPQIGLTAPPSGPMKRYAI